MEPDSDKHLEIAVKVLAVLERGSFNSTYKYATLLGLIDLCLEHSGRGGDAPDTVTTRELALKVTELYWMHTIPYRNNEGVLRQNQGPRAKILAEIMRFRHDPAHDASASAWRARLDDPPAFARLLDKVEWVLIHMPLPKLQRLGQIVDPFLYEIGWTDEIERQRGIVRRYQSGDGSRFDNRIRFVPGAANALVALSGLLRPFIYREWCAKVAKLNQLEESELEEFLFGRGRTGFPRPLRDGLRELQSNGCFYCGQQLGASTDVDHFIPWSRHPDDSIENLVLAHSGCNGFKRDHLAASGHLQRWWERSSPGSGQGEALCRLSADSGWLSRPDEARSVGRGIYLRLPSRTQLWIGAGEFEPTDPRRVRDILHGAA